MSYKVQGAWTEIVEEAYDDREDALAAADRLAREHPDTVIMVTGNGFQASVAAVKEAVEA